MRIVALYNLKGGVGKSTTAANLACLAAQAGERTLLVDLDAQGAAGYFLGHGTGKGGGRRMLEDGADLSARVERTAVEHLDIVPARFSYRRLDERLRARRRRKGVLRRLLSGLPREYAWVFLDTPAGLTLLSENVFAAADHLLVPLVPAPLSVRAWERIVVFLDKKGIDRKAAIPFFSLVHPRRRLHQMIMQEFRLRESSACLAFIPALASIESAAAMRTVIALRRPHSPAGLAFAALWTELRPRLLAGPGR
jgi:chromosome partitioning protein